MYKNFIVEKEDRLDKFLTQSLDSSRNQILQLIKKDFVKVDGKIINKNGFKLKALQNIEVFLPQIESNFKEDSQIIEFFKDFDIKIIYEDEDILVLNKPANLTVHEASSTKEPTLVDWLKLKNISLSTISGDLRHGIVHRLDKGTSGILTIAKTNEAHQNLAKQFEERSVGRYYIAIIDMPLKDNLTVEKDIGRNPNNRLKMAVIDGARYAKTSFLKLETSFDEKLEFIACKLFTGRTHQIRVHLNSLNRHILEDSLYGFKGNLSKINRFFLHAYFLEIIHPIKKTKVCFKADIPQDLEDFINKNFSKEKIDEKIDTNRLIDTFNSTF
ncbi:RluA family pseudouridine synthase [Aliarcobacter thereius]|uniref:Pseudouridine synthase n=1 Tax=Aliarcobacter thereius LMG 24486 TaxID=1032240 RepID=A0A1C7WTZ3_9BACT|nr:RluA family pseudouridine synthase [Aliarcobacter thereius]OCL96307.1 Ribosomal large subunit pseudouridine synthase D [Aliarcobacter thereius LMG 24486]QBF15730.1 23S rRNA pseudouridine synthase [Aliarcobacter thereius LMG 24486]TLS92488.1 RluA family pseudouridine synthase [Aliarcobacter thereius]